MKRHLFLCYSVMCLLTACHSGTHQHSTFAKVEILPIEELIGPYEKEYIGVLKPINEVTLRARVEGFLEQRLFKDGDFVKKDDILFLIDKKPFEAQLLSAKGNLEKAKANLAYQKVQYKRYQQLVVRQDVSKSVYDQQYAQYLEALGNLDIAKGQYEQALLNLSYCEVFAPISGQVGKAMVDIGNLVSANNKTELVKLIQLDPMRVEFNPSASDMSIFLKYRQYRPFKVEVSLEKFHQLKWHGVVDFYDNAVNLGTSTLLLRTTIVNQDLLLRPELYVNVKVTLDPKHRFILVPYEKISAVQGIYQVLVVNAENVLIWRKLQLGKMHQEKIEIEGGLQTGDRIVVNQKLNVQEGVKVEPILIGHSS